MDYRRMTADLFFPARHKFLKFLLQFLVEPVILLSQVFHLLFQPTFTMLINNNKAIDYNTQFNE